MADDGDAQDATSSRRDAIARVQHAWKRDLQLRRARRHASRELVAAVVAARAAGWRDHEIARALVPATGEPGTAHGRRLRLAKALRERLRRARRATQRGANVRSDCASTLPGPPDVAQDQRQEVAMSNDPVLRRRIIEEYGPPDAPPPQYDETAEVDLGDAPGLGGDEDEDEDDDDDDDEQDDEDEGR